MIQRVADLLAGALRGAGLEKTSVIWQIAERWEEIVGPRVASRAAPTRLRGGELTLSAPDAVWRQELSLLGPEIAAKVNQKIKEAEVSRVRVALGSPRAPAASRRVRRLRGGTSLHPPPAGGPEDPEAPTTVVEALEALARARATRLEEDDRARRARRARIRRRR